MAEVITFGIQKGGVGKSTTTGIIAHLMAQEGKKVLVVDMDSQGNVTDLLTQVDPEEFEGQTVLEAIKECDPKPYIMKVTDNIHVLPSDDFLATLPRFLYTEYGGINPTIALRNTLDEVKRDYDFILIDTPPSLGEQMTNAICTSDWVVVLAEGSKWAFTAIPRFLDSVIFARDNINPRLNMAGILRSLSDSNARRMDPKVFIKAMQEDYPELVFDTVIKRKSATGRLPLSGFEDNKELNVAIRDYKKFYKELKQRIGVK